MVIVITGADLDAGDGIYSAYFVKFAANGTHYVTVTAWKDSQKISPGMARRATGKTKCF